MIDSKDIPTFGIVDPDGEHGILSIESGSGASCRLTRVSRTERGYPRDQLAVIPLSTWRQIATAVQRELVRGMDLEETGKKAPVFRSGAQVLSPLVTRELAVLLWSLMEDGEGTHIDALLAGWRQLAREERWWLYARASNPTQCQGRGWRRALFYALTDPADTRTAPRLLEIMEVAAAHKNNSESKPMSSYTTNIEKKPGPKKGVKSKVSSGSTEEASTTMSSATTMKGGTTKKVATTKNKPSTKKGGTIKKVATTKNAPTTKKKESISIKKAIPKGEYEQSVKENREKDEKQPEDLHVLQLELF